jgi:hypothetical protein
MGQGKTITKYRLDPPFTLKPGETLNLIKNTRTGRVEGARLRTAEGAILSLLVEDLGGGRIAVTRPIEHGPTGAEAPRGKKTDGPEAPRDPT